jgi:hypothetical protein
MRGALVATLAHPEWWAMALAAFLVRGGILVVAIPIVMLPTTASLITAFAPPLEALILGRPSLEGVLVGTLLAAAALAILLLAALTGTWLDLALVREAADDEELELAWRADRGSPAGALLARLVAHVPTFLALGYGATRIVAATYDELIAPGDLSIPIAVRVAARAPDAVGLLALAWLAGETVGPLAARRRAAGVALSPALRRSVRQLASGRGLVTLVAANVPVLLVAVPFAAAAGGAWLKLVDDLTRDTDAISLFASLLLLPAAWVLGLAVLGAALAWRATAWTTEVAARAPASPEPAGPDGAPEGTPASSVT